MTANSVSIIGNVGSVGAQKKSDFRFTFSSSYPSGGEQVAASRIGLFLIQTAFSNNNNAYGYDVQITSGPTMSIKAFQGGTEVVNGTDLSAVSIVITAYGS